MRINIRNYGLIIFLFFYSFISFSQRKETFVTPDSLKNKTYSDLFEEYYKTVRDTTKSLVYLYTYLQKGKEENNIIETAKAYSFLAFYQEEEKEKERLLDTAIYLSKRQNHFYFPTVVYSFKGGHYYEKGRYRQALDNYLLALQYAKNVNNTEYIYISKHNIAELKTKVGDYEEAKILLKECYDYEKSKNTTNELGLLTSLISLSDICIKQKQFDSSAYYINRGIEESKKTDLEIYSRFILNQGIILFHKKEYSSAKKLIRESIAKLSESNDKSFLIKSFFYLGRIALEQENSSEANNNFKKNDSLFSNMKFISPFVRESYEYLITYYKSKKDVDNQLLYIQKLLRFDSISLVNNNYLENKIRNDYDTPELISEKESIIRSLKKRNEKSFSFIYFLFVVSMLLIIVIFYNYKKKKKLKQRFEDLLKNKEAKKEKVINTYNNPIGIAQENIDKILKSLDKFEKNKNFLKHDLTTSLLAKEFKTNSKYLSKIINSYKQKSFVNYVNDLRIDYAIDKLQSDIKFRNYTIKAISKDSGFNTSQAFSKSFYKKTGIQPSYFIRELIRQSETFSIVK